MKIQQSRHLCQIGLVGAQLAVENHRDELGDRDILMAEPRLEESIAMSCRTSLPPLACDLCRQGRSGMPLESPVRTMRKSSGTPQDRRIPVMVATRRL